MPNSPRPLGTIREAAAQLSCSERSIRRLIDAGTITGYRIGPRMLRLDLDELEAALRPVSATTWGDDV